jgi:ParB-like chromosome segregation protein Spo0J
MNEISTKIITVDPDFASIWGNLEGDAFEGLKTEIEADGIRDPLVIWHPDERYILIDGHNRLMIAKEIGRSVVPVSYKVFGDKAEAAEWIVNHQSSRRNISEWQKYKAVEVYQNILKEKAKKAQATSTGGNNPHLLVNSPKAETDRINTRKETAKAANLSEWQVRQGDYIQKNATPEQKADLDSGKKTMKEVYRDVKGLSKTNRQAQKEFVDSVKQEREDFKEQKSEGVVSFEDAVRDKENAEFLAQELYRRCMRLGSQIDAFYMEVNEKDVKLAEELKPLPETDKQRLRWQFDSWRNKLLKLEGDLIE